jgi:hypothetical protein
MAALEPESSPDNAGRRLADAAVEVICQLPEIATAFAEVGVDVKPAEQPARRRDVARRRLAPIPAREGRENSGCMRTPGPKNLG